MKVFSVKVGPAGERLVTGSTAPTSPTQGNVCVPATPDEATSPYSSGLAVSVLPLAYQKRLMQGGQISLEEFRSFDLNVVR